MAATARTMMMIHKTVIFSLPSRSGSLILASAADSSATRSGVLHPLQRREEL